MTFWALYGCVTVMVVGISKLERGVLYECILCKQKKVAFIFQKVNHEAYFDGTNKDLWMMLLH